MTVLTEQPRTMMMVEQSPFTAAPEMEASDAEATIRAIQALAVPVGSETYYEAADPGYKSAFTRDTLITMMLLGDPALLETQIDYSARRIGQEYNPKSGAEPGKAHHELPSAEIRGLSSAYNGCDTTATLLRSIAVLAEHGHPDILNNYASPVQAGVGYIKRHVNSDGLFEEDPKYSGATEQDGRQRKFALKVTDWKDSELNRAGRREPNYPIVYTLAHFQNAEALQKIGMALGDERLARYGRYMAEAGIDRLWSGDHFVTAIDGDGVVDAPSTDSLHALLYISPRLLKADYAQKIELYSKQLETDAGYRSGIPAVPEVDPYHMMVWTHEQALLHAAAQKHGLYEPQEVTSRITDFIFPKEGIFPEIIDPVELNTGGNIKQLWAMGAYLYFQNPQHALL